MRWELKKENFQYKNYIITMPCSTEVGVSLWDRNYGFREKAIWQFSVRGISVSGYNKIELVALAYSAAEMDLLIIFSSADLTKNLEEEYSKRVRTQHTWSIKYWKRITSRQLDCLAESKSWKHFWIYSENESIWQRIYR